MASKKSARNWAQIRPRNAKCLYIRSLVIPPKDRAKRFLGWPSSRHVSKHKLTLRHPKPETDQPAEVHESERSSQRRRITCRHLEVSPEMGCQLIVPWPPSDTSLTQTSARMQVQRNCTCRQVSWQARFLSLITVHVPSCSIGTLGLLHLAYSRLLECF